MSTLERVIATRRGPWTGSRRRGSRGTWWTAWMPRAGRDPIGRVVKRADLEDNLDLTRVESPGERDRERMEKYRRALEVLLREPGDYET